MIKRKRGQGNDNSSEKAWATIKKLKTRRRDMLDLNTIEDYTDQELELLTGDNIEIMEALYDLYLSI